jgi:peptidoglycan/xylan/chitin deacetylase (PgdA/CDA1 family)
MNDLVSAGIEVGGHGWGYVDRRRLDDAGLDLEIEASRDKIANVVGCPIDKTAILFREV